MSLYEALIFDLDGTLWDSSSPVILAWNTVLDKHHLKTFTAEELRQCMGLTDEEIFRRHFPDLTREQQKKIAEECLKSEVEVLRRMHGDLYPGVREGLEKLSRMYKLFLVSNCQSVYLKQFYETSQLGKLFLDQECYGNTGHPKADNIKAVIKRNKLTSSAYIGDTSGDESASRTAGIDFYHVAYGFGSPAGTCLSFESFDRLVEFFIKP